MFIICVCLFVRLALSLSLSLSLSLCVCVCACVRVCSRPSNTQSLGQSHGRTHTHTHTHLPYMQIYLYLWSSVGHNIIVKLCCFIFPPGDTTGKESIYTVYEGHEVMFHISTLLPYSKDNRQQVRRSDSQTGIERHTYLHT